ncbi:hypothetical protein ACIBO5_38050 [Nonomuraea angiospora]|uniref:hypothetical protein n=1 Tax=Nonomuraea angiospora TaxID=46172 RepID=UPI003799B9AC
MEAHGPLLHRRPPAAGEGTRHRVGTPFTRGATTSARPLRPAAHRTAIAEVGDGDLLQGRHHQPAGGGVDGRQARDGHHRAARRRCGRHAVGPAAGTKAALPVDGSVQQGWPGGGLAA